MMRTNLSSRATWFLKFAFPVIWTAIIAAGAVPMIANSAGGHGPRLPAALSLAAVWLIGAALILAFSGSIVRVQYRNGHLYASNFRREIEILPGDIASITQNIWINVRPITIHLRTPSAFGQRIRLIPQSHVVFRFWAEDPIADELRAFARGAPDASSSPE